MRLQIHRRHFGVDPDGQWWQNVQGDWIAIDKPSWANKKKKQEKVVNLDDIRMKEPEGFKRSTPKIEMITCYKVTVKTVPDYEAEVLCRNGWTTQAPIFACAIDEGKQLALDIRNTS
jgi:hypothetical protein